MRILITGARGFIGGVLSRGVAKRWKSARLFLLNRSPIARQELLAIGSPGSIQSIECDLADPADVTASIRKIKPDLVFHAAGLSRHAPWADLWEAHVSSTMNLMEALLNPGEPKRTRVIVVGSSGEYGRGGGRPVNEDLMGRPVTAYGASKLCESLCALSYVRKGLQVMVGRVFNVVGPAIPPHLALGTFAHQIAQIESGSIPAVVRVGNLKPKRDYVDVRDVADALIDIAQKGASGEIYNVCSGRAYSMEHLLRRLMALSPSKITIIRDSARFRRADAKGIVGSYRKLKSLSGWRPRISLDQSLNETLEWYRDIERNSA